MINYVLNNLSWIIPSLIALIVGILTINFPKEIKKSLNKMKFKNINLKNSTGNTIKVTNNAFNNNSVDDLTNQQKITANHHLFELTDGLIKLTTAAFRPLLIGDPKNFAEYLTEIIEEYNKYTAFFDSKEIFFDDEIIKIVNNIKAIVFKSIRYQQKIENFKSMNMPWEKITPEIDALHEIYYNQIEKELPQYRENLKKIIKKK